MSNSEISHAKDEVTLKLAGNVIFKCLGSVTTH